jgi:hypothetical protein
VIRGGRPLKVISPRPGLKIDLGSSNLLFIWIQTLFRGTLH